MKIEVTYIPSEHKFSYGYVNTAPNGKIIRGLQLDPFKEMN